MEIGDISVLQRQEKRETALELITKVASYVKPLMRKHGLKVGRLVEFFPKNRYLYGTNYGRGLCVSLRLRDASDKGTFLDFETILETMLHELCHNTFGPHNTRFFALLESYKSEMFSMVARGFKGDLFVGPGRVLGGRPKTLTGSKLRRVSKIAGRRLGGPTKAGDRRAILAEAAERRRQADKVCAPVSFEELGIEEISYEEFHNSAKNWKPTPDTGTTASPDSETVSEIKPNFDPESKSHSKSEENKKTRNSVVDLTKTTYFVDLT